MKHVTKIQVRLEGDINEFWDFFYTDGTQESYHAFEESPVCTATDRKVYDIDPKLNILLTMLSDMTPAPDDEYGSVDVEFDSNLNIINVDQQAAG